LEKEKWKNRPIRMPDELWFEIMQEAGRRKLDIAEFVRQVLKKEIEEEKC